jgi:hypothetical protein
MYLQPADISRIYGNGSVERWTVCTPLSVSVFATVTQQYLEYHCKAHFETPYITSGSHIEP